MAFFGYFLSPRKESNSPKANKSVLKERSPQNIPYPDPCVMMYDHSTGPTAPVVL